jgi:hypothetical protein
VQRTRQEGREKPKKPPLPFRGFHTTLARPVAVCFRPSAGLLACLLHLPPPHLASVQPASQRQVKRSGRTQPRPTRPTREGGVFALQRPRLASRCELLRHLLFSAPPFLQAGLSSLLAARSESVSGSLGGALPPPAGTKKKKGSSLDSC